MTSPSTPQQSTVKPSKDATKMVLKRPSTSSLESELPKRMRAPSTSSVLDISVIGCPPSPHAVSPVSFDDYPRRTEVMVTPSGRRPKMGQHVRATSPKKSHPSSVEVKKNLGPSDFVEMVYLDVGPAEDIQRFGVHKGPLCFYSKTFRRAFEGTFKEAQEGVMKMPTDDPEVVKIFVGWVYSQKHYDEDSEHKRVPLPIDILCRLYFFADKQDVRALRNAIIDTVLKKIDHDTFITPNVVPSVYANTTPASPLRKVFVDYLVHCPFAKFWVNDRPGRTPLPTQFLVDFSLACHGLLGSDVRIAAKDQTRDARCYYHEHEEGEKCEQKSRA